MARFRDDDGFELEDWCPHTGRTRWSRIEPDGTQTIRTDIPATGLLSENAEFRAETRGRRFGDDWCRVASIPENLFWASGMDEADLQEDHAFRRRWLNEHSAFKTREAVV